MRISVAENTSLSSPLYSAHAEDADSGENGRVTYALAEESDSFKVFFLNLFRLSWKLVIIFIIGSFMC